MAADNDLGFPESREMRDRLLELQARARRLRVTAMRPELSSMLEVTEDVLRRMGEAFAEFELRAVQHEDGPNAPNIRKH